MSAQIIILPAPAKRSPVPADPAMKRLYWGAVAWARADRAGKSEAEKGEAASKAFAAPTPGEAEILKLLRRIERRLAKGGAA